jgi:hypothetical protein
VARDSFLLRTDPQTLNALRRWAEDELRSVNGQIEFLLRRALKEAGRSPADPGCVPADVPAAEVPAAEVAGAAEAAPPGAAALPAQPDPAPRDPSR